MDPFEAAFKKQQELDDIDIDADIETETETIPNPPLVNPSDFKCSDDDDNNDNEDIDVLLRNKPVTNGPDRLAKLNAIVSSLTEDQMNRFVNYRRSRFKEPEMRRLLISITGMKSIPDKLLIVVSGIAKLFVGDVVEAARTVMVERNESGKIGTRHIREAYRRLKLEGKVPKRLVPRRL